MDLLVFIRAAAGCRCLAWLGKMWDKLVNNVILYTNESLTLTIEE